MKKTEVVNLVRLSLLFDEISRSFEFCTYIQYRYLVSIKIYHKVTHHFIIKFDDKNVVTTGYSEQGFVLVIQILFSNTGFGAFLDLQNFLAHFWALIF